MATTKQITKSAAAEASIYGFSTHQQETCPHCGIHLSNGVGQHNDEVNGKPIKHKTSLFACLGCGEEFGPAIRKGKATKGNTGKTGTMVHKPEDCADDVEARARAVNRKRPVTAKKFDGTLVLCSARTARKHGWAIQATLYGKKADVVAPAPATKKPAAKKAAAPAKKAAAPAKKATAKRKERLATLEEMLG